MANKFEGKLDVYRSHEATAPTPVVMTIHLRCWIGSNSKKDDYMLTGRPYLVTAFWWKVEYRLRKVSLANGIDRKLLIELCCVL